MNDHVYTDRGYGIGGHRYNDTLQGINFCCPVRQIVVWDVCDKRYTRYDLDTRAITALDCSPVSPERAWTWEQVDAVVSRDLAQYGIRFGQPYLSFGDRISRK